MLKNVGAFFGLSKAQSVQWKDMAQRKVQDGEFGFRLRRSKSEQRNEECKFMTDASNILLRINKTQKLEDEEETQMPLQKPAVHGKTKSSTFDAAADEIPQSITDTGMIGKSSKESYNPMYQDHDVDGEEFDVDQQMGPINDQLSVKGAEEVQANTFAREGTQTERVPDFADNLEEVRSEGNYVDEDAFDKGKLSNQNDKASYELGSQISSHATDGKYGSKYSLKSQSEINKDEENRYQSRSVLLQTANHVGIENNYDSNSMISQNPESSSSAHKETCKNIDKDEISDTEASLQDGIVIKVSAMETTDVNVDGAQSETKGNIELLETHSETETKNDNDTNDFVVQAKDSSETSDKLDSVATVDETKTDSDGASEEDEHETKDDTEKDDATAVKQDFWKVTAQNLVYGQDAFKHYKFFLEIERKVEKQKLQCRLEDKLSQYGWKIQAVEDLISAAKDYYTNPGSEGATRWRDLKRKVRRSSSHHIGRTEVRRKLAMIPEYRPFFTYFLIVAQLASLIVTCAMGGITFIGLEPRLSLEEHIPTFRGLETVHKWTPPNIWIGPDHQFFIGVGAVFAPCMREDFGVQMSYALLNYTNHLELGCCEMTYKNVAGTTTQTECNQRTSGVGNWRAGVTCAVREGVDTGVKHVMKPCCVGLQGQCQLLSHKHCLFLGGSFYQSGPEHCSQVCCLKTLCSLGDPEASKEQPWLLESPNQWWRIPLSLFYHHGIIQLVLISLVQLVLMSQIERSAGWLRVLIVYLLSGSMALLTSAVFSPYQSHVGGVGALFGMLGVVTIELIQFWSIVKSPLVELVKILAAFALFAFLGTFPYIDFYGMLTGFVFGIISGMMVLPYITFGRRQQLVRTLLLILFVPLLLGLVIMLSHLFRKVQSLEHCEFCKRINCVAYSDKMCDTSLWQ